LAALYTDTVVFLLLLTYPAAVSAVASVLKDPASTAVSTMSLAPTVDAKSAEAGRVVGVGRRKAEAVAAHAKRETRTRIVLESIDKFI